MIWSVFLCLPSSFHHLRDFIAFHAFCSRSIPLPYIPYHTLLHPLLSHLPHFIQFCRNLPNFTLPYLALPYLALHLSPYLITGTLLIFPLRYCTLQHLSRSSVSHLYNRSARLTSSAAEILLYTTSVLAATFCHV